MIPNHQPVIFIIHPWVCGFVCRYDRFPEFTFPFIWAMPHFRTTPRNPQGILRAAEPTRAFSFKPQSLPHKHSAIDIQRDAASGFGCPPAGERAKHPEIRRANQTAHVGLCRVHSPYGRGISQDLIPPPGLLFFFQNFPWLAMASWAGVVDVWSSCKRAEDDRVVVDLRSHASLRFSPSSPLRSSSWGVESIPINTQTVSESYSNPFTSSYHIPPNNATMAYSLLDVTRGMIKVTNNYCITSIQWAFSKDIPRCTLG